MPGGFRPPGLFRKGNTMGLDLKKYVITVKNQTTQEAIETGCLVMVYTAGTQTLATIYANSAGVSKSNPITRASFATKGKIEFWAAASSVDLYVAHSDGTVAKVAGVTPTRHSIELNVDGIHKTLVAPFVFNAGGTEVDTGLDFPVGAFLTNARVEVTTLDASETLQVGLLSSESGGDADGILKNIPLDNATMVKPWSITDTTTEDYISAPYFGALMGVGSAGTSGANDFGQPGGAGHKISTAVSLSYTPSTSDTAAGYIYVDFMSKAG